MNAAALFNGILAGCAAGAAANARAVQSPISPERASYETALRKFDWQFEFSDDGDVYRRGREALARLREQQQRIDPAGTIWLSIAPRSHGVPQPKTGSDE